MGTRATQPLSASQVEQFHRDGYLVFESLFHEDELQAMRAEADRILELVVNSSIAQRRNHMRASMKVWPDGSITMRKVQPVNDLSEVVASISADDRLLGPMRQLMGDEPLLMEEKLNYKQWVPTTPEQTAGLVATVDDDRFPLHHDWGYYAQQGYPENTISSAVALDDCAGRGPIKVIPGSHLFDAPLIDPDPAAGDGRVVEGVYGPERVAINAPAGSVMVFHARLLHDSEPNESRKPRRMMIYSHYPASHGGDPDRRNGPTRRRAQAFEQAYRELVARGQYTDTFRIPNPVL